jgi:hypothetical protein
VEQLDAAVARQRRGKYVSTAKSQHATVQELLEAVFFSVSVR